MILITGATGFVGGRILEYFSEKYGSDAVLGIGRNPEVIKRRKAEGFLMGTCDLNDPETLAELFKKYNFTAVIHAAAKSSPWGTYKEFYNDNVVSTQNLLNCIKNYAGIQLIYISTPSIYFNYSNRLNVLENAPINYPFVNDYTKTKFEAELLVKNYAFHCNDNVVIFRPRAIIGRGDTVIIPRVLKAYDAKRLRIIGYGETIADFTSVENLCFAISLALEASALFRGEIFNITDENPENLWDFIKFMLEHMELDTNIKKVPYQLAYTFASLQESYYRIFNPSVEPTLTRYGLGILKYSLTMDITKAKELLGYKPIKTSRESVLEYVNHSKATI